MNGLEASARWSCSHHAPDACPWCSNPKAEVWRDVSDFVPMHGLSTPPVVPVSTLAEFVDAAFPGFWERGAGGAA